MAIKLITHKSRQILYVDYQECETESALIALLEESARTIASHPGKVRLLSNFRGIVTGPEFINRVKKKGVDSSQNNLEKSAIIGIGGLTSILVDGYFRAQGEKDFKVLENMEEACDWLAGP
jgi:hypothetical protein